MTKNKLKVYHGIILIILAAIDIFFIAGYLGRWFGFFGTLLSELILLALAVGVVFVFGGDSKKVFPVRRPKACQVFGTFVLWLGTLFVMMIVAMIMLLLFPKEMAEVSEGISSAIRSVPFVVAFAVVVIAPAICEEAVFRGSSTAFLSRNRINGSQSLSQQQCSVHFTAVSGGFFLHFS